MTVRNLRSSDGDPEGDRVFVLRFWLERPPSTVAQPMWRAKVTETDGGEPRHANSVDEALALVRSRMRHASDNGTTLKNERTVSLSKKPEVPVSGARRKSRS